MVRVTTPVDHANHADCTRVDLEIDRVGEPCQQYTAQAPAHHGIALRLRRDLFERAIDGREEVGRRVWRPNAIPLEGVVNLRLSAAPDDERGHLAESGAELVAKHGPRDTDIRVRISFGLASIELDRECGRERGRYGGVETIPEATDERDALLGREGFECRRFIDHEGKNGETRRLQQSLFTSP